MKLTRRDMIAAAACTCLPGVARAESIPPSGAVAMLCSAAGISGLLFEGEDGAALDPDHRWHIGSNSKAMTAALYARLVERQRCRWGATMPMLFPSLSVHPGWSEVTVEELLSHSAGLTDSFVDAAWLNERRADPASPVEQRRALAERVLTAPPPQDRGVFRYGNLNYVLVGAAIEQATGASWEDVVRDELFAPLGMTDAGFGAPPRDGPWGRAVQGDGLLPVDPLGIADNPAVLWPSGGVHLSPSSYAPFLSIFLRDGAPLLRPETLRHLLTPSSPGIRYAGGWSLEGAAGGEDARLIHNGSNTLWFATAVIERQAGRGYAAMTNCGGDRGAAITARLIKTLRPSAG